MRAALVREFGGFDKINIEEVPKPQAGDRQVLIRVQAAGVNPVDTYIREGKYTQVPELPYIPGKEGAGVVEEVGSGISKFKSGDRVWFIGKDNGASAEFVAIDEEHVFSLHERINFKQGATCGLTYCTAYRALFQKAGAQAGQTLLVHGASGGVGLAACELAKVHGLRVVGTASTQEGIKLATQQGAEIVFNHREAGYVEQIKEKYPNGFDIILEMLANENLCHDLEMIAKQGRIVVIGNRGSIEFDPRACMIKDAAIIGVSLANCTTEDFARITERLNALMADDHVKPYVGTTLPLEQLAEAHRRIMEPGARGKFVVTLVPQEGDDGPKQAPSGPGADQPME